ncbi:IS3 family transposase, partial [Macrococcoides caseolyticum]|uniref:IS3 family transposase n=1 Tax=Macrococcoides caseolyticum TaxID=69966 RepID=UPI0039C97B63
MSGWLTCNCNLENYYRWKNKDFSISEDEREIIELCKKHRFTYGYRKITALLNRK